MRYIFGLGNPDEKYKKTRHNSGSFFVDFILEKKSCNEFKENKYVAGLVSINDALVLIKPITYMNLSGESFAKSIKYFKIDKQDEIYIAYDDLDIKFGEYKIHFNKYPKIHNGILNILDHSQGYKFWNIRIGIDSRTANTNIEPGDYVLLKYSEDELVLLRNVCENIWKELSQKWT